MVATVAILWFPQRYIFGVDLRSELLQGGFFALVTVLWSVSRSGNLASDPYLEFRSGIWSADAGAVGRNIFRLSVELIVFAAVLEVGQFFLTQRHGTFGDFLLNAIFIVGFGALFYFLVALALRTRIGKRLVQLITTLG